jgi:hypothetical protein
MCGEEQTLPSVHLSAIAKAAHQRTGLEILAAVAETAKRLVAPLINQSGTLVRRTCHADELSCIR